MAPKKRRKWKFDSRAGFCSATCMLLFSSFFLPNTPILQSKTQIIFKNLNRFPLYRMIIGTAVFQLLMVGVVALKGSFAASCLVLPLPVMTVFFYLFILQHYIRPSANLSLKAAHSLENPAPNFLQVRCWKRKTDDRIFSRPQCSCFRTMRLLGWNGSNIFYAEF